MKKLAQRIPVPIAGLMLALATTGNLLLSYGSIYRNIFGSISGLILILLILKIFLDFKGILKDLENPIIASTIPTFTMGVMILTTYIKPYIPLVAKGIWILAIILHCFLIVYFTVKFILKFNIKKVFPSYFIVYVGIAVVSITAPAYKALSFGRVIFWFGFISYLMLLPIVTYRIFCVKQIQEPALPTIIIMAAPPSLCLAGYISSFQEKSIIMIGFLTILSLIMFIVSLLYIPKILRGKFYPSYSALTFPLAITAVAMKQTNVFLIKNNNSIGALKYLVKIQELIAVSIVIYVLIKYFKFMFIKDKVELNKVVS
ncbi:TDT family transporter [Hathewaya limosa]|uniref:Exfoliative toxin A/B n=2 Tax=Bacteria TaxID=2 RepID=A0ABU0JSX2_HATLI|nr:TDT family transporter [Hathewaya limosa]AWZ48026.1 C4-dicarboxylate ABC transporter [Clostridiaceae bacterium 14S0207]MDQ0479336.1 exfoliative toxin A/B [Hathewaya limosa]